MSATLLWLRLFFCGFLVIAAMLGVTLLTPVFYGDLTRIGYLSEHDFGWTAPQPAMAEGDLRSARFADADVLVLGDSFSAKLRWQSVLVRRGMRVKSLVWDQVPGLCADFVAWVQQQGFRGRIIIAESVERGLSAVLTRSATCQMKGRAVADTQFTAELPPSHAPGFEFNGTEALGTGVRTAINTWRTTGSQDTLVLGETMVRPLPGGCRLFSHRECERVLLLALDARMPPLGEAALEHMLALRAAARPFELIWLIVPDKTSVYFERDNAFWRELASRGLGPDLYTTFAQDKWRIRDLYAPNDTHLSSAGYLRLGELVADELANREIRIGGRP